MKCKACNADLSDFDVIRKGRDGAYLDLCQGCFTASEETLYEDRQGVEILAEAGDVEPEPLSRTWNRVLEQTGALVRWQDGLWGKRAWSEVVSMEEEAYAVYLERVAYGQKPVSAAESVLKITTPQW